jgi:KUP system potassium uptake protein
MMPESRKLPVVALGALGVVFGDIGTSPLYAVQQCFTDEPQFAKDPALIIGILSLIVWSIILVVCVKYVTFILRADHDGEGGTLAMLGLLRSKVPLPLYASPGGLTLLVLFGSALLYGDGVVTPAISVLSAVEGLELASPDFKRLVVPLSAGILLALFLLQRLGTAKVGRLFGPIMLLWFATIAVTGAVAMVEHPAVLAAFNPLAGLRLLFGQGWAGYLVLGAIVLCFSGTEALFADLGHFGRRPIVLAWYVVVLPALGLNYLGQGARLLTDPHAPDNPFFAIVPHWGVIPMVILATAATVIASQALISGAFSLTQQAINMGFAPRYAVVHTSEEERGQIYMPVINYALMVGCLALVFGFRSSAALGAAYGLAVIGTMVVTSITFFQVTRRVWQWPAIWSVLLCGTFLVIDCAFLGANLAKLLSGAWVPLLIGGFVFAVLAIWTEGRARYRQALAGWAMALPVFQGLAKGWKDREEGAAVFLTESADKVPLIGRHEWLRNHVRHEQVLLLRVETSRQPHVSDADRMQIEDLGNGIYRGTVRFGFMHTPDLTQAMSVCVAPFDTKGAIFFLPQITAVGTWPWWRRLLRRIYLFLGRTGLTPVEYFNIPPNQVVAVGMELTV